LVNVLVNVRRITYVIPDNVPLLVDENSTNRRGLVETPITRKDALKLSAAAVLVAYAVALLLAVSGEKAQAAFPGKNGER